MNVWGSQIQSFMFQVASSPVILRTYESTAKSPVQKKHTEEVCQHAQIHHILMGVPNARYLDQGRCRVKTSFLVTFQQELIAHFCGTRHWRHNRLLAIYSTRHWHGCVLGRCFDAGHASFHTTTAGLDTALTERIDLHKGWMLQDCPSAARQESVCDLTPSVSGVPLSAPV